MRRYFPMLWLALGLAPAAARAQTTAPAQSTPARSSPARSPPAKSSPPRRRPPDTLAAFLRRKMERLHIPGLQFAVVQHGKIVQHGAYGVANVEDGAPVTDDTLFPVHSITKAFVGVAVMQLVEAGQLDLAAPVSRYLDGLPAAWRPVTIRQLLTHVSGIPDVWDANARLIADGEQAVWAKVQTLPMQFSPGARFSYNQANYVLLGKVIDKLAGMPFTRFIAERQFRVAGLRHSGFSDSNDVVPHLAGSYEYAHFVDGKRLPTPELHSYVRNWPPMLRTAVGLDTSATELAEWVIALQAGKLLRPESRARMVEPGTLADGGLIRGMGALINGYANGWQLALRPEHRALAPTGGNRAALFVYPDDDLTVIILTNLIGSSPSNFIDEAAGYFVPGLRLANGFGLSPPLRALNAELRRRGFAHGREAIAALQQKEPGFAVREDEVNNWGYQLLALDETAAAIEVLTLNAALHPESANAYDSLAESYEAAGERAQAIASYRRSLELDPKNDNARQHLAKLEGAR